MLELNLSGKTAIIGGASQGIGEAIAHQFAGAGANLILLARNISKLEQLIEKLPAGNHFAMEADYLQPKLVVKNLGELLDYEKLEPAIYIHNTGGPSPGPAHTSNPMDYQQAFTQHLLSGQYISQLLIPYMKEAKWGRIVNIISTSVKAPLPNLGVSNTIRGAVAQWAKTLATELGPYGITVNNVLPGATATERLDGIISNKSAKSNKSLHEVEQDMLAEIPAKRFGLPAEIAYACTFLCSDLANYINGINLPVDGGRTPSL